jgi:cytochrome c556
MGGDGQMNRFTTIACIAALSLLAACGQKTEETTGEPTAQAAPGAAGIIADRQDKLKKMAEANRVVAEELKKSQPDLATLKTSADFVAATMPDLINWFPAGTGPESGIKTAAKAHIWEDPADFTARYELAVAEARKFQATVAAGDIAAIKTGVDALGASCRNCHQLNRERD